MSSRFNKYLPVSILLAIIIAVPSCGDPAPDVYQGGQNQGPNVYFPDSTKQNAPQDPATKPETIDTSAVTYLALGDSYTIGQSVSQNERWPVQLVKSLVQKGQRVEMPTIIAQTGWTTNALLSTVQNTSFDKKYDLVSLLIGVNNQYIGQGISSFQKDMEILLDISQSLTRTGEGVFVLSIPDYGATPFGEANAAEIGKEIDEYNEWIASECYRTNIPYFQCCS